MHTLIEDLLTFSRYLRPVPELVPASLVEAAEAAVATLAVQISDAEARVDIDSGLPVVLAEPRRLVSLLQNLIGNGIKFRRPGQPAVVRVHSPGKHLDGRILLAVDDNGLGVDPRYRERIFLMFQRLHEREAYEGNGIGLAICQKIVESAGGTIWFEESPLGGARVAATFSPAPGTS
jgi:light-regulated signal transduction histidine kinase (bacteriophytochrome)